MFAISDKSHFVHFWSTGEIVSFSAEAKFIYNKFYTDLYHFYLRLTTALLAKTTLTTIKGDPTKVLSASSVNRAIFLCVCCISWSRTWHTPSITSLRVDFCAYLWPCVLAVVVCLHILKNVRPKFSTFVCQNMLFKSAIRRLGRSGTDAHPLPKNVTICLNVTSLSLTQLLVFYLCLNLSLALNNVKDHGHSRQLEFKIQLKSELVHANAGGSHNTAWWKWFLATLSLAIPSFFPQLLLFTQTAGFFLPR